MKNFAEVATLLIDGNQGIHIGQQWSKHVVSNDILLKGIDRSDVRILLLGADHAWYFETWEFVVDEVVMQDKDGVEWRLHQNEDLWIYPNEADINWHESFWTK